MNNLVICVTKEIYNHVVNECNECLNDSFVTIEDTAVSKSINDMLIESNFSYGDTRKYAKLAILTDMTSDALNKTKEYTAAVYAHMPYLFDEGVVQIISPPLYSIIGTDTTRFIRDNNSHTMIRSMLFNEYISLALAIDGDIATAVTLEGEDFTTIYHVVEVIGEAITKAALELDTEPALLETLIHCLPELREHDAEGIKAKLGLTDCFYERENSTLVFDLNGMTDHIHITELITIVEETVLPLLEKVNWEHIDIIMDRLGDNSTNAKSVTFIEIYDTIQVIDKELNITKIKSICELSKDDIFLSCLNHDSKAYLTLSNANDISKLFKLINYDEHNKRVLTLVGYSNV